MSGVQLGAGLGSNGPSGAVSTEDRPVGDLGEEQFPPICRALHRGEGVTQENAAFTRSLSVLIQSALLVQTSRETVGQVT